MGSLSVISTGVSWLRISFVSLLSNWANVLRDPLQLEEICTRKSSDPRHILFVRQGSWLRGIWKRACDAIFNVWSTVNTLFYEDSFRLEQFQLFNPFSQGPFLRNLFLLMQHNRPPCHYKFLRHAPFTLSNVNSFEPVSRNTSWAPSFQLFCQTCPAPWTVEGIQRSLFPLLTVSWNHTLSRLCQ